MRHSVHDAEFVKANETSDKFRPRSDRLRATWIVTHLQAGTRIKELTRALGVEKFENLPRYLEYVQALDVASYRAQLRGTVIQ
ncbi:hypothetical protein SAMN05216368_101240 [Cryobacterium flavum]|uniref:Uncharacterized protein n=1 Tax=Cryobacterium flavum TaxID=1424659 RepID=A0A4R8V7L3_9MICO|nr:hypothetical protein [Cryobacterium flavum]TFB77655.1 hypothetical protein E3O21_08245 [Cryobacterium flavum]SDM53211.1 hypothetical protein SAMN05216368_101240 [Cryobacterium flavum]